MASRSTPPRDTSLATYRARRDFAVTAEPTPHMVQPGAAAPIFVVQKHQAHRAGLHWDFRLEHDGVLWSWAVRKGPSLDPHDKRIAVHVEDHPRAYADFQGTIPDGQYGAGRVETWDRGTWQPIGDPAAGMRDGAISFVLAGRRLHGAFTLVRLRPRANERRRQDNWLLIKQHDAAARAGADAATLEAADDPPPPVRQPRAIAVRIPGGPMVSARAPSARIAGVTLTHPDRELWPGISKRRLAAYWLAVADHALPGLVRRPLAILRCPDGIGGAHFFQKHAHGTLPDGIRAATVARAPYLAIDDLHGLLGMVQIAAIELHAWGAAEADPLHPDQLVFDLDPGEGVAFPQVVTAAHAVRRRLERLGLAAFCRTTGGKGLHVVAPLRPAAPWDAVKRFCRSFAEAMTQDAPDLYLATVKLADRRGRILVDWLRNSMGATAIASFCPRARQGAGVATPLAWGEVTQSLDPADFTLATLPARLTRLTADPWADFATARQPLPDLTKSSPANHATLRKPAG